MLPVKHGVLRPYREFAEVKTATPNRTLRPYVGVLFNGARPAILQGERSVEDRGIDTVTLVESTAVPAG